jgi:hypothetical protein
LTSLAPLYPRRPSLLTKSVSAQQLTCPDQRERERERERKREREREREKEREKERERERERGERALLEIFHKWGSRASPA